MKITIPPFEHAKILVVGDVMLDRYWHGDAGRISPEAPVPVLQVERVEERLGGAGNVALNICALGGQASLLGLVGDDAAAATIDKMLAQHAITNCLLQVAGGTTINKLRVVGRNQQLIRLDFEGDFGEKNSEEFLATYLKHVAVSDLIIFSDYGKGTLSQSSHLIGLARQMNKVVLVDPKGRDFSRYHGATLLTPNLAEFEAVVGECRDNDELEMKAMQLLKHHEMHAVLVTRGAQGMSLVSVAQAPVHLPTKAREVYDVTGAGDTVIAALGAALAVGTELVMAMQLANSAAGIVVRKFGAATVSSSELRRTMQLQQDISVAILDEEHLLQQVMEARARGEKIVFTNGCFDILHAGHINYLTQAKELGQKLIVAVNDDTSVRRLKGATRPINRLAERMLVLAALNVVDWVVPFTQDTPEQLIKLIKPDILVKGGDYQEQEIAGAEYVQQQGGRVVILPFVPGCSTTALLEKINSSGGGAAPPRKNS